MTPSIGRIVILKLSASCAEGINARRRHARSHAAAHGNEAQQTGVQVHWGNDVAEGDEFPMVIVRIWGPEMVNGQVLLDGSDTLWATSVHEGDQPGEWHWPERVE